MSSIENTKLIAALLAAISLIEANVAKTRRELAAGSITGDRYGDPYQWVAVDRMNADVIRLRALAKLLCEHPAEQQAQYTNYHKARECRQCGQSWKSEATA